MNPCELRSSRAARAIALEYALDLAELLALDASDFERRVDREREAGDADGYEGDGPSQTGNAFDEQRRESRVPSPLDTHLALWRGPA